MALLESPRVERAAGGGTPRRPFCVRSGAGIWHRKSANAKSGQVGSIEREEVTKPRLKTPRTQGAGHWTGSIHPLLYAAFGKDIA